MDASLCRVAVGIPPLYCWISNLRPLSGRGTMPDGEFDWGGRLRKSIGALEGSLRMVGNHSKSAKAEGSLTATPTGGAGTKVGLSDPVVCKWECHRSTDKSYPGDNRLISPKSSHRRGRFGTSMSARRILGL